jgi:hypothetical protein
VFFMLVKFRDKERPHILFEKEYADILPILQMVNAKTTINIFLDQEGVKRIIGRLYDFEYTIEIDTGTIKKSLIVILDCCEMTVN